MYIIQRLAILKSTSPIISGDYILSDYFLRSLDSLRRKSVSDIVNDTGISKTTVIHFCQKGGFTGVSPFLDELAYEYESLDAEEAGAKPQAVMETVLANEKNIRLLADTLKRANNVYIYGKLNEILTFDALMYRREILKKNVFFLVDWSFKDIDEKLSLAGENDALIMIDTQTNCYSYFDRFSFRALYFQKDVTDRLPLKKFFIGRPGAEVKDFHQIVIPEDQEESSIVCLTRIWNYISAQLD